MRDCEALQNDLKAYQDGELSPVARLTMRLHVARCVSCREELNLMENISNEMKLGDAGSFDEVLRNRILSGIPDSPPEIIEAEETKKQKNKRPVMIFGATSVALLAWFVLSPIVMKPREMVNYQSIPNANMQAKLKQIGTASMQYAQDYDEQVAGGETKQKVIAEATGAANRLSKEESKMAKKSLSPPALSRPQSAIIGGKDGKSDAYVALDRRIHRTASLTVEVDNVEARSNSVEEMVKNSGGYVASNSMSTNQDGTHTASLSLQVPEPQFESIMSQFAKLGTLKAKNTSSEDLTEQISNSHEAMKVLDAEVGEMQRKLKEYQSKSQSRTNAEIMRDLKTRIAINDANLKRMQKMTNFATIELEIAEKPKFQPTPSTGGFMDDMRMTSNEAARAFAQASRLPFMLMIWVMVYSPVWLMVLFVYRRYIRG